MKISLIWLFLTANSISDGIRVFLLKCVKIPFKFRGGSVLARGMNSGSDTLIQLWIKINI